MSRLAWPPPEHPSDPRPDGTVLAPLGCMFLAAAVSGVDLWAFVALAMLWAFLLTSAFFLYRWLWQHDTEDVEDFHLGL